MRRDGLARPGSEATAKERAADGEVIDNTVPLTDALRQLVRLQDVMFNEEREAYKAQVRDGAPALQVGPTRTAPRCLPPTHLANLAPPHTLSRRCYSHRGYIRSPSALSWSFPYCRYRTSFAPTTPRS